MSDRVVMLLLSVWACGLGWCVWTVAANITTNPRSTAVEWSLIFIGWSAYGVIKAVYQRGQSKRLRATLAARHNSP